MQQSLDAANEQLQTLQGQQRIQNFQARRWTGQVQTLEARNDALNRQLQGLREENARLNRELDPSKGLSSGANGLMFRG